jgi:hypothetical protein
MESKRFSIEFILLVQNLISNVTTHPLLIVALIKKAFSLFKRKSSRCSSSYLTLNVGFSTNTTVGRLLKLQRASPSTSLDKIFPD